MMITCRNYGCVFCESMNCEREEVCIGVEGCESYQHGDAYYRRLVYNALAKRIDRVIPLSEVSKDMEFGIDFVCQVHQVMTGIKEVPGEVGTVPGIFFHKGNGQAMRYDEVVAETNWAKCAKFREAFKSGAYKEKYGLTKTVQPSYGWLAPDGTFTPAAFGDHYSSAKELIAEHGWEKEYEVWSDDEDSGQDGTSVDYLITVKGYVLIHGTHSPISKTYDSGYAEAEQPLTDKQKDYLYRYYLSVGDNFKAALYAE